MVNDSIYEAKASTRSSTEDVIILLFIIILLLDEKDVHKQKWRKKL